MQKKIPQDIKKKSESVSEEVKEKSNKPTVNNFIGY